MDFKVTCQCGWSGKLSEFVTVSPVYHKKSVNKDGEAIILHLEDRIIKCPGCGEEERKTVQSSIASFVDDGSNNPEDF